MKEEACIWFLKYKWGKGILASKEGTFLLVVHHVVLGYLKMIILNHGHFKSSPSQTLLWKLCSLRVRLRKNLPERDFTGCFPHLCDGIPDTTTSEKKGLYQFAV